jgi:hypothetical protein
MPFERVGERRPDSGSGTITEEKSKNKNPPGAPPSNSRKHRCKLPEDFVLTLERANFALEAGLTDPNREFALFTDHWRATGGLMLDWNSCWQKWCRNAAPGGRFAPRPPTGAADPRLNQSLEEMQAEIEEIRGMEIEWARSYTSSLRRGYIVDLFQQKGIFSDFVKSRWPNGATHDGEVKTRRYLRILAQYQQFLSDGGEGNPEDPEDLSEQAFAAESDLRDFLAQNLGMIEPGLRLHKDGERCGVEFPVGQGRVDILAVDREGKFVVVELKLSMGRAKALGQLLYYMGWVDRNLGNGPCRGAIVAREVSDELLTAAQRVSGLKLFQYSLKVALEKIA